MPREVITRPEPAVPALGQMPLLDNQGVDHSQSRVEARDGLSIGWSAGGEWLQVYIQPFGSKTTSEWAIALLNRDDANRLIRAVRKARDAAFGADA